MSTEERIKASFATDSAYQPLAPAGMVPYPFQRAGVEYALQALKAHKAAIIADDMGLGKTVQALCVANALGVPGFLVLCPASLRINWAREAKKWLLWANATIVGYEELVRHPERAAGRWHLVVFDEAQYLKSPAAKRTVAALGVETNARLFLSGTPLVNRPVELWPVLHAIPSLRVGSLHEYGVAHCGARKMRVKTRRGWKDEWKYDGACNLVDLQRRLRSTVMVRRLKKDVLKDLPPKVRQIIELPNPNAAIPEKLMTAIRGIFRHRKGAMMHSPEAIMALREAQQTVFEQLAKVRHEQALVKVPQVVEHVKDLLESTEKVVVFAHHRDVIEKLFYDIGHTAGIGCARIYGGMTDKAKQMAVDLFQTDPTIRVFIGQIQAAGVGLTLTAASTVVFAELDWTPGNMAQCEDRCHRIGQKDSVLVQHLVLEGSLDARISKTLLRKQQVIDQTLDSGAASAELDWVEALAQPED